METVAKRLYEGLFLVDSAEAVSDWNGVLEMITKILERGQVEIVSMKKWDDRKLAYDIERKNRGTYILVYFNAEPKHIAGIERDIRLSEKLMRALIIRGDKITKEDMDRLPPIERPVETPAPGEREGGYVRRTEHQY